jgi:broad specificity phosphatase PhoE
MARQAGTITIARHGQPAISRDVRLNAAEYEAFWARYEIGGLAEPQSAPEHLTGTAEKADVVFVSTRRRAVESARILVGNREVFEDVRLIEAPLPSPPFPHLLKMSPKLWGFFARFWWWWFNHHKGQETRRQASARAKAAAADISAEADKGKNVLVIAHGFFNAMLGVELRRLGWRKTWGRGWKYWSTRRYERR